MRKKTIFATILATCLLLSACTTPNGSDGLSSHAETSVPESGNDTLDVIKPEDVLLRELAEKGFDDLRGAKIEPFIGNNNGCESTFGEFDASELLIYKIDPDLYPDDYIIAAVTKDLQNFFLMSQADGILYDIRDNPSYIHEGEYSREMAQQELERCLRAETNIDPDRYDIFTSAKHLDVEGIDVYYVVLNEKDAAAWTDHAYEFYVSKDLRSVAQIDYIPGLVEERQYLGPITLDPGNTVKNSYTIDEAKEALLRWLQQEMSSHPDRDSIEQKEVLIGKVIRYEFRIPNGDGAAEVYEIFSDLRYANRLLATETMGTVRQLTYLKGEKL